MKLSSDIRNARGNYPYKYKQIDMARLNKWATEAGRLEEENEALGQGCKKFSNSIGYDEVERRLNATEKLKGHRAKGAAICLEGAGCSNYTDELIAYADTLEDK